jgi:hypothetical protein
MKLLDQAIGHVASCKHVSHLLSQAEERPLTTFEGLKVRWHLAVCDMCRAFESQLRTLREAMRRFRQ